MDSLLDARLWADMFALGLPIVEKIVRVIAVYLFLVFGLRLAGKRELAQLNAFDLVVLLTLSNAVQNAIIGRDDSVTGGLISAAALLVFNYGMVRFTATHPWADRLAEGVPDVVIENGVVRHDRLRAEVITVSELESAARRQGFASLDEIDRAVLEPGGSLSFIGRKPDTEDVRHAELLARLDTLAREVAALRTAPPETRLPA